MWAAEVIYPSHALSPTGQQCGQRLTWQRDARPTNALRTLEASLLCQAPNLWHRSTRQDKENVAFPFLPRSRASTLPGWTQQETQLRKYMGLGRWLIS